MSPIDSTPLRGRVALVTGAGRGIGRAVAGVLGERGAGVAVNDVDGDSAAAAAGALRERGVVAISVPTDVTDEGQVVRMVAEVHEQLGRLDILVNNAGVGGSGRHLVDVASDEWRRVVEADLTSVYLCSRAALAGMIAARRGWIVNVSSVYGMHGAAGSAAYSAAKAGVIGLTRALAKEVAMHRINVNAVAPGLIDTAMSRQRGTTESMRGDVRWYRIGQPEDIAALVAFLVSDEAEFITGQVICADGGSHI